MGISKKVVQWMVLQLTIASTGTLMLVMQRSQTAGDANAGEEQPMLL
jgi:hypothetical protein